MNHLLYIADNRNHYAIRPATRATPADWWSGVIVSLNIISRSAIVALSHAAFYISRHHRNTNVLRLSRLITTESADWRSWSCRWTPGIIHITQKLNFNNKHKIQKNNKNVLAYIHGPYWHTNKNNKNHMNIIHLTLNGDLCNFVQTESKLSTWVTWPRDSRKLGKNWLRQFLESEFDAKKDNQPAEKFVWYHAWWNIKSIFYVSLI